MRAQQKGLELACHIRPDVPDALVGDPGRLRQIVVNLVGNAIKFTERGEVVLHAETQTCSEDEVDICTLPSPTRGSASQPEKQNVIFDAFEQADRSTTRKYGGTGLGLAICSQLVKLMGGRLWLESQVGQGSTFCFTAPFSRQEVTKQIGAERPASLRGSFRARRRRQHDEPQHPGRDAPQLAYAANRRSLWTGSAGRDASGS